jgi:hypothetical protein
LSTALPIIGSLQQDFHTARDIFYHLGQCHRFTAVQLDQLDALILAKNANMHQLLRSYDSSATAETSLYLMFCHWASLGFHTFKFFMHSTAAAVEIVSTFPAMKTEIDSLPPLLNGLVLGSSSKSDCQSAGRVAVHKQQTAYNSIRNYFNVTPPLYEDANSMQAFLRCYVEGYVVCHDMSVTKMKGLIRGKTLHATCQLDQPDSIWTWEEYGTAADVLNNFFTELRTTVVDPQSAALSKIPGKKAEVQSLKIKVTQALSIDSTWSLEVLTLLQSDVADLLKSIRSMADDGVDFDVPTIGANRDEFTSWREALLKKIKIMGKSQSDRDSKEKALERGL